MALLLCFTTSCRHPSPKRGADERSASLREREAERRRADGWGVGLSLPLHQPQGSSTYFLTYLTTSAADPLSQVGFELEAGAFTSRMHLGPHLLAPTGARSRPDSVLACTRSVSPRSREISALIAP